METSPVPYPWHLWLRSMSAERRSITMVAPKLAKHRSKAREVFRKSPLTPRQPGQGVRPDRPAVGGGNHGEISVRGGKEFGSFTPFNTA